MAHTLALVLVLSCGVSVGNAGKYTPPTPPPQDSDAAPATATHFYFLLDRSGSMSHLRDDVIGGINTYVREQQVDADLGSLFTLVQFDGPDAHQCTVDAKSIHDVEPLTRADYVPRGMTPLYDAIGRLIARAEQGAAEKRVIIVFTDGQENASREHSMQTVKKLIDAKKDEGWAFVFLGANVDAFAEGGNVGIARGATQNWHADSGGVHKAFSSLSKASSNYVRSTKRSKTASGAPSEVLAGLKAAASNFFDGFNDAQEDFESRKQL